MSSLSLRFLICMRVFVLLILVLLSHPLCARADAPDATLRVGAATRIVNPTRPAITIGHRVMKQFENVYADICAQVMVIEDGGGRRLVWMGMDFCVLQHEVVDRIKNEIDSAFGIPPPFPK